MAKPKYDKPKGPMLVPVTQPDGSMGSATRITGTDDGTSPEDAAKGKALGGPTAGLAADDTSNPFATPEDEKLAHLDATGTYDFGDGIPVAAHLERKASLTPGGAKYEWVVTPTAGLAADKKPPKELHEMNDIQVADAYVKARQRQLARAISTHTVDGEIVPSPWHTNADIYGDPMLTEGKRELQRRLRRWSMDLSDEEILSPKTRRRLVESPEPRGEGLNDLRSNAIQIERERRVSATDENQLWREQVQEFTGQVLGEDYEAMPEDTGEAIALIKSTPGANERLAQMLERHVEENEIFYASDIATDFVRGRAHLEYATDEEHNRFHDFIEGFVPVVFPEET